MKNLFAEARNHYKAELPKIFDQLKGLEVVQEKIEYPSESIQKLFPKSSAQPLYHLQPGNTLTSTPLKVGVVLSGGQAAGGHNVIIGLYDALKKVHVQSQLFGFLGGPAGIVDYKYKELVEELLDPYRNTGGFDLIGSGRTKIETPEQLASSLKNCLSLDLDGLVIIGGDDSNTNAAALAEYFLSQKCKTCVIGVPKTIDGDLKNNYIETSFGFDTACKIYSEMIGNICRDALSAKKYTHFIKLMGRSASHIALECALQVHPNLCLIGEEVAAEKMTLRQITESISDCIVKRARLDKHFGVILIPEGLIEFVPEMKALIRELNTLLAQGIEKPEEKLSKEAASTFLYLPEEIQKQLLLDRDPHGNVQVSHIATDQLFIHTVKETLNNFPDIKAKFSPVGHFFGYEGRCGYPSNFDASYCTALGFTATALIANKVTGYMSVLQKLNERPAEWKPLGIPITMMMNLEERKGEEKAVIKKALVDLEGEPFKYYARRRKMWEEQEDYCFPGPIQYFGPSEICDATTCTLKLEHQKIYQVSL